SLLLLNKPQIQHLRNQRLGVVMGLGLGLLVGAGEIERVLAQLLDNVFAKAKGKQSLGDVGLAGELRRVVHLLQHALEVLAVAVGGVTWRHATPSSRAVKTPEVQSAATVVR